MEVEESIVMVEGLEEAGRLTEAKLGSTDNLSRPEAT